MFWLIYNVLLVLGSPVIVGLLLTKKRCQRGLLARLGQVPTVLQHLPGPVVWVHAVSLGEVTAVVPLLRMIKEEDPHQTIVVSTVTETGREMVLKRLNGIATHCYAPLDFWWAVNRYIRVLNPRLFLLVESEIWPNLLTCLKQNQVPVCLVNGRISSRSFSRYRLVRRLMKPIWSLLDMALMQTAQDAERIEELGANAKVVHVTGNMKFDQTFDCQKNFDSAQTIRTSLGISEAELVIVAGSTHPKEEEQLLDAYQTLSHSHMNVVLIMAPRHVERAPELEAVIARFGLSCVRRSQMSDENILSAQHHSPRVIVLDSRGELPYVFCLGFVGFVGGTLVPVGGHNLLEPAQWGRPVIFGTYVDHCRDIAHQLLQAEGGIQIHQPKDLVTHLLRLLEHPAEAEQMGRQALAVVQQNRGVVKENLRLMGQLPIRQHGSLGPMSPSAASSVRAQIS
ncbi:MAG: 3-deoxy-D-manno-octulosonic acid transferase [Nitrospirales bacterium]